jgi:ribonuclease P/MRP protein subunit POP5
VNPNPKAMKHLPKHLRPRWRYLAVDLESWPDAELDRRSFQREVWFAAQNLLGDATSADLDGTVLGFRFEQGDGEAVVRARRGEVERLRAALGTVDEVDGWPLGVVVRGVSGTVRACEEKYIRRPTEEFEERTVAFADADRPAVVRNDRVDVRLSGGRVGATALDIRDN